MCYNYSTLPSGIGYPAELKCPHCGYVGTLESISLIGVQPKQLADKEWQVVVSTHTQQQPGRVASEVTQISFGAKLDKLAGLIVDSSKLVNSLETDLIELSKSLEADFVASLGMLGRMAAIDSSELARFIYAPVSVIPISAIDADVSLYTSIAIVPKFLGGLKPGFILGEDDTHRFFLVSPYSLMAIGNEDASMRKLFEFLRLPVGPDISIHGSKIIGNDLTGFWERIPGIQPDSDHTTDMPSVIIINTVKARCWLSSHCVSPRMQEFKIVNWNYAHRLMTLHHRTVLEKFEKSGRMLLCWSRDQAIEFANEIAYSVDGRVLFVGKDGEVPALQAAITELMPAIFRPSDPGSQRVMFCDRNMFSDTMMPQIRESRFQFNLVIVDMQGDGYCMSDITILESLMLYSGNILILGNDPIIDTLEDNVIASRMFAVCNSVVEERTGPSMAVSGPSLSTATSALVERLTAKPVTDRQA
jgi:hypothetical protein